MRLDTHGSTRGSKERCLTKLDQILVQIQNFMDDLRDVILCHYQVLSACTGVEHWLSLKANKLIDVTNAIHEWKLSLFNKILKSIYVNVHKCSYVCNVLGYACFFVSMSVH